MLDETDIVYVAHVPARRIMSITIGVGTRDPAFATSLGRVLLAAQEHAWLDAYLGSAQLSPITGHTVSGARPLRAELGEGPRARGTRLVDQELEDGLRAVAVPIHDAEGRVVAAVNLAVHAGRWTVEAIRSDLCPASARRRARSRRRSRPPTAPAGCRTRETPNGDVTRDADFVQSLERGLSVIRAFDGAPTALTLSDVAKTAGLPRAAARRFLLTLVELGYMDVDGRRFRLRPRVLDLGRPYLSRLTLPDLALPHMRAFVEDVRESSTVAVLDGSRDRLRRACLGAADPLRLRRRRDARSRVRHCAWPGAPRGSGRGVARGTRALLPARRYTERTITKRAAFREELARVREQGYALVDQELEDGLRALAVPIRDGHDRVIASVNVAVHTSRWPLERIRGELLPRLFELAGGGRARRARDGPEPACERRVPLARNARRKTPGRPASPAPGHIPEADCRLRRRPGEPPIRHFARRRPPPRRAFVGMPAKSSPTAPGRRAPVGSIWAIGLAVRRGLDQSRGPAYASSTMCASDRDPVVDVLLDHISPASGVNGSGTTHGSWLIHQASTP